MKLEPSKNRRNSRFSPEKRQYLNFSSCTLYIFMKFCILMQNGNTVPKMWRSPIFEKLFSGRKCHFYRFSLDFFYVVFSLKNILNNNTHHQALFNCQYNWFLKPKLSKNRWKWPFFADFHLTVSLYILVFFTHYTFLTLLPFLLPFFIYH